MLICKNCGARLADHSKICYACKTPVTPETVIREDPFAEGEAAADGEPVANGEKQGPRNIWEERYGKDAENKKDPIADYDWQDEGDLQDLLKRLESGEAGLTDEELLIGPGAFGYGEKFKKMREKNRLLGWNWGAFLLGPIWFAYRKMYPMSIVTILMAGFFGLIFRSQLAMIISLILDVSMALFGDRIYLEHISRLLGKVKKLSKDQKPAFIRRHGGVAIVPVMILFLVYWIFSLAVMR